MGPSGCALFQTVLAFGPADPPSWTMEKLLPLPYSFSDTWLLSPVWLTVLTELPFELPYCCRTKSLPTPAWPTFAEFDDPLWIDCCVTPNWLALPPWLI